MTVPKLGCTVYNVDDNIKELVFKSGDTLMEFLTRALSVNQSVISAGIKASPNALLKRFIEQMMLTTLLQTHAKSLKGTVELSWRLHICYGHKKLTSIQDMIKKGYVDGISKATKLPREKVIDFSKAPIRTLFHLDLSFFNVISVQGATLLSNPVVGSRPELVMECA